MTPKRKNSEKKFGQASPRSPGSKKSKSPRSPKSGTFKKLNSSSKSRRKSKLNFIEDGTQSETNGSNTFRTGKQTTRESGRGDTQESSVGEECQDVMLTRFSKPPKKFPKASFFDNEENIEKLEEMQKVT